MADERCTPHGPTLAEMVTELLRLFPGGSIGSPNAHLLISALAEIDRRLTAIEGVALPRDPVERRVLLGVARQVEAEAAQSILAFFEGLFRLHDRDRCPGSGVLVMPLAGGARCADCSASWGALPGPRGYEPVRIPEHTWRT